MLIIKDLLMGMVPYTPYISFGLLLLAGLNIPVSEDVVFIISASIAATLAPENRFSIFVGCFLGAFVSDLMAYTLGKYGINRILSNKMLIRIKLINPEKMEKRIQIARDYFDRYGGKTIFIGRFIPFGVRNAIFMTCGIIGMKPLKFMAIDFLALLFTSTILFSLGYTFGNNYEALFPYIHKYKFIIIILVFSILFILLIRRHLRAKESEEK
ncbi:MAG: DedA family protein [Chrysiogenales bacterium]|nr:MAG: DedA family protein [Chrysiogenales bacterium]